MKNITDWQPTKYILNDTMIDKAPHVKHRHFSKYIDINFPEFKITEIIKNKYPFDTKYPNNISFADFYIYTK